MDARIIAKKDRKKKNKKKKLNLKLNEETCIYYSIINNNDQSICKRQNICIYNAQITINIYIYTHIQIRSTYIYQYVDIIRIACKNRDKKGTVRFIGETEFASGTWYGVELVQPVGVLMVV